MSGKAPIAPSRLVGVEGRTVMDFRAGIIGKL
jgi:hypothetical protein